MIKKAILRVTFKDSVREETVHILANGLNTVFSIVQTVEVLDTISTKDLKALEEARH